MEAPSPTARVIVPTSDISPSDFAESLDFQGVFFLPVCGWGVRIIFCDGVLVLRASAAFMMPAFVFQKSWHAFCISSQAGKEARNS
jgi:hypothetical protein